MLSKRLERVTDTMGRMHSDAQFAGSSSVPAHVEMIEKVEFCSAEIIVNWCSPIRLLNMQKIVEKWLEALNEKTIFQVFTEHNEDQKKLVCSRF